MSLINDALKRASQAEKARAVRPQPAVELRPVGPSRPRGSATGLIFGVVLVVVLGCSAWFLWHWWNHRAATAPGPLAAHQQGQGKAGAGAQAPVAPPQPSASNPTRPLTPRAGEGAPQASRAGGANSPAKAINPVATANPNPAPRLPHPLPATNPPGFTAIKTNPVTVVPAANNLVYVPPPPPQVVTQVVTHVVTQIVAQVPPPPPPATTVVATVTSPPPPPKHVEFPPLQVQGIAYREKNPSALINGRTVFVGDHIGDVKVLAIEPKSVKVELEGAIKTLWL